MKATTGYTRIQQSHADALIARARFWTRGTVKETGEQIVIFPSSKGDTSYYTSERGCTCQSYLYRGNCAHELALRTVTSRQQAYDSYKRVMGLCEQKGCMEDKTLDSDLCEAHAPVPAFG